MTGLGTGATEDDEVSVPWWRSSQGRRQGALIVVLAGVLVAMVVQACAGSDDADGSEPPPPPPPSTTATTLSPEAEAEQAYRDFVAMTHEVYLSPDPADPRIAEHATGDARDTFETTLTRLQTEGIHYRIGELDKQTMLATTIEDDTATLSVCYVDHSGSFDSATGAEVQPMRVTTSLTTVSLQRASDRWLVSTVRDDPDKIWEGEYTCGA